MGVGKLSNVDVGDIDNVSSVSDIANISGVEYSQNATVFTIDTSLGDGNADMLLSFTSNGPGAKEIVVNWGDGTEDTYTTSGDKSHTYSTGGVYTVSFFCNVNAYFSLNFGLPAEREAGPFKITDITQWGTSLISDFKNSRNLTNVTASGQPNYYSAPTTGLGLFNECRSLVSVNGIESWDVDGYNLQSWFVNCLLWDQDVSGWDVSNVTEMYGLFWFCQQFNQDISGWNVSNVTDMELMFVSCNSFDQNLGPWTFADNARITQMFALVGMSDANVALTFEGWDRVGQGTGVNASILFGNGFAGSQPRTLSESTYPDAKTAYDNLISTYSWDLTNSVNWVA